MVNYDDLQKLQVEAQIAIDQKRNKYGRIGLRSASGYIIPAAERNKRMISVTLEDGTVVIADGARVSPTPGARVRLRVESSIWVIKGADEREALTKPSNVTIEAAKHNHNPGTNPGMFYAIDPAGINNGMLTPTGSGLECVVGRVEYIKTNGRPGIYDAGDTLDFASAVSGLDASESRWAIAYILSSDGSVGYHISTPGIAPLNTTSDLESAITECLSTIDGSSPFHAVRIRAGMTSFGTYKPMVGVSVAEKDFIRIGFGASAGSTASSGNVIRDSGGIIGSGKSAYFAGGLTIIGGLTVSGGLTILS